MLRFKVGELAILAVVRDPSHCDMIGERFVIRSLTTRNINGGIDDYQLDYICPSGRRPSVMDFQLQKIDHPAEPASLTRHADDECTA